MMKRILRNTNRPLLLLVSGCLLMGTSCVSVAAYQKMYLNDKDMTLSDKSVQTFEESFQTYREGVSGGNGGKTGGGCGCN